jgi:phosphoglycolate phosphatase
MIPSHVFFDLDGTLTDPREGIVRSISHALAHLGRPVPDPKDLERFIGPPLVEAFRTLLETTDDALIRSAIDAYRRRFATIGILENRAYPGVTATLDLLRKRDFSLYLLTSKANVYARRIADHFDLTARLKSIYGPELDDLKSTKVALLRDALARESVAPATAVVVGDRKEDIIAARENGARAIGVTWGYGSREELESAGARYIVCSFEELVSCLGAG